MDKKYIAMAEDVLFDANHIRELQEEAKKRVDTKKVRAHLKTLGDAIYKMADTGKRYPIGILKAVTLVEKLSHAERKLVASMLRHQGFGVEVSDEVFTIGWRHKLKRGDKKYW